MKAPEAPLPWGHWRHASKRFRVHQSRFLDGGELGFRVQPQRVVVEVGGATLRLPNDVEVPAGSGGGSACRAVGQVAPESLAQRVERWRRKRLGRVRRSWSGRESVVFLPVNSSYQQGLLLLGRNLCGMTENICNRKR